MVFRGWGAIQVARGTRTMTIGQLTEEFLRRLEKEKGCSSNTIRAYATDLYEFFDYLISRGKIKGYGEKWKARSIDSLVVRSFLAELFRAKKRSTIARKLSALRSFFTFLEKLGLEQGNPASEVSTPKLKKYIPVYLTVDEAFSLLGIPQRDSVLGLRDAAILEVLYSCGLRVSEASSLNVASIDFDGRIVRVVGKGNKERLVPIGRQAVEVLRQYLEASRPIRRKGKGDVEKGPLFINYKGGRLTPRSIARIIKKYALQCGLSSEVSPHAMRHTFATHMLDGGADLRAVQELLGHESLSTTQKYTHLTLDKLMEVYDKAHPRSG